MCKSDKKIDYISVNMCKLSGKFLAFIDLKKYIFSSFVRALFWLLCWYFVLVGNYLLYKNMKYFFHFFLNLMFSRLINFLKKIIPVDKSLYHGIGLLVSKNNKLVHFKALFWYTFISHITLNCVVCICLNTNCVSSLNWYLQQSL